MNRTSPPPGDKKKMTVRIPGKEPDDTGGRPLLDPKARRYGKKSSRPARSSYAIRRAYTAEVHRQEREARKEAKRKQKEEDKRFHEQFMKERKEKKAAKKKEKGRANSESFYSPPPPNFSQNPNPRVTPFLAELARRHLYEFIEATKADYKGEWFHKLIARKVEDLVTGKSAKNRLMIFVPPQHGKSQITSRSAPAWIVGRNPGTKVVIASYSATLAEGFNRDVQRTIEAEEFRMIFPELVVGGSLVQKNELFETSMGGFVKAVGVGGALTGTAVDIGLVDDPLKDAQEAYSEVFRDRVWEWWVNVFETRLHNNSKVILIMTRWHHDDLAGRLLDPLTGRPDEWDVVVLPAIKDDQPTDIDPRQFGEPLWPERHSLQKLEDARQQSPRSFNALYQQSPEDIGGNIVKREWFGRISRADFNQIRDKRSPVFFLDTAYTEKQSNDPTGMIATTFADNTMYIFKAQKKYLEFPALNRNITEFCKSNGYVPGSSIRVEPKASGKSVVQQLKHETLLNVVETPIPKEDKTTRLNVASPAVETGRVVLVEDIWVEEFLNEVCGFPNAKHDEYVDLLSYAVDHWIQKKIKRARMTLRRH